MEGEVERLEAPGMKAVSTQHSTLGVSQDSDYVVAVRNFLSEDPELLSFHKGDIIHLQNLEPPRVGQFHGWVEERKRGEFGRRASLVNMLMQAPATGYSAGCVVRKKLVYLEELRRRGPDFGEYLQITQT